jgi:tetratricopeptide (TPR) repeat protein
LRAPSEIPKILREVVQERHVPLIDFQSFVEARSEHGIPGANLFLDHVHPTVDGYRLLALEILKTLQQERIVSADIDQAVLERTTQTVLSRIDARTQSLALMNLCKTLGWAGKREEAYRAGMQAAELGPAIAEVQYQTGLAAQLSGRTNEALAHYRQAIQLQPTHGDAHCALGVVLEDTGHGKEALDEYRLALRYGKPKDKSRNEQNVARLSEKLH